MSTLEHAHTINGVEGRMFAGHTHDADKGTFSTQTWKASRERGKLRCTIEISFDDDCGNGHNTFSITGQLDERIPNRKAWRDVAGGQIRETLDEFFPELAGLYKWHLVSTDGPMHYLADTLYHAGDRDHNGLRAGETRQKRTRHGTPMWELVADIGDGTQLRTPDKYIGETSVPTYALDTLHVGEAPPATPTLRWQPCMETGIGKKRELDFARSTAVWPEASDDVLCSDDLRAILIERLPRLLADFRAAVESCGFAWEAK